MRIGYGFDIHQLVEGRKLILGGVEIPFEKGLLGHSDADVLLHAITDALLGALSLGDIGQHFPDTDPAHKDADSRKLLTYCYNLVKQKGYVLSNLDATIVAQRPKLMPYLPQIINQIAEDLEVDRNQISVKATTSEKLGFVGREEGISATAVVLIQKL
ncbi:MAG: 2-C-methyl-D-erythritol 2,4-cyclodiphosphate synthase [Balneolaceae bacterium]